MNLVHKDLVILYLICWMVECIHDIILFLWDVKEAIASCARPKPPKEPKGAKESSTSNK